MIPRTWEFSAYFLTFLIILSGQLNCWEASVQKRFRSHKLLTLNISDFLCNGIVLLGKYNKTSGRWFEASFFFSTYNIHISMVGRATKIKGSVRITNIKIGKILLEFNRNYDNPKLYLVFSIIGKICNYGLLFTSIRWQLCAFVQTNVSQCTKISLHIFQLINVTW